MSYEELGFDVGLLISDVAQAQNSFRNAEEFFDLENVVSALKLLEEVERRAEAAEAKIAAVEAALEKYEYDIPGPGDLIETRHVRAALGGTA